MRMVEAAAQHRANGRSAGGEQPLSLGGEVRLRRVMDEGDDGIVAERVGEVSAGLRQAFEVAVGGDDRDDGTLGLRRDARADAAEHPAEKQRKQRPEQEEDEGLGQHRRGESRGAR